MKSTLEAAIRANPADPRRWSVYGDWLEGEGDPRGQFVGMMLARETSPTPQLAKAVSAFLEANRAWLLPPEPLKLEGLVWRRGFLHAARFTDLDGLRATLAHPSAQFLAHVVLAPYPPPFEPWLEVLRGEGWPSAHVLNPALVATALAWPRLERLHVELDYRDQAAVDWADAAKLTSLRVRRISDDALEALLRAPPPQLKELRLWDCQGSAVDVLARFDLSGLSLVSVDGAHSAEGLDALATAERPAKLVLGMAPDAEARLVAELPGVLSFDSADRLETALVLIDAPTLSGDMRALLETMARKSEAPQVVAFIGTLPLCNRTMTVLRLHGEDTSATLLPSLVAHALTKATKARTAVVTVSESNDLVKALSFGGPPPPEPAKKEKRARPRVELAAADKMESADHFRNEVVGEVLSRLLGCGPGADVCDALLLALDEAWPVTLRGAKFTAGMPLPALITDEPATPDPDEEEEDEDEFGDEDDEDHWDDAPGPDSEPPEVDDGEVEREPSRIDVPIAVEVAAPVVEEEADEEDEDPDEHVPDLVDADEGEIWNEGPVDPEEEWTIPEAPAPPAEPDPEQLTAEQASATVAPSCVRCATPAETTQCRLCFDELCEACMPPGERRVCPQCVPI